MITLESLQKDYDYFKAEAGRMIQAGDYEHAVDAVKTAGTIAQNFCLHYADDELEQKLCQVARNVMTPIEVIPVAGRLLFYDSFARDNVMLSAQYIRALISWGSAFLYITSVSESELKRQELYGLLKCYPKAQVFCLKQGVQNLKDMGSIYERIIEYKPQKALLQMKTEDVLGLLPWYILKGIKRYYIEVTDHSFWLGANAIDRCISFRNYGYSIALTYRGLKDEQLLIQPFYSTVVDAPFEGIPEYKKDSIKLFSGGRITKIMGENDAFFNLVKRILDAHPNTEFYFAGGGLMNSAARMGHAEKFIRRNHLEQRFHLLGQRRDIRAVAERMDVFINTYPFGGGLMCQLAAGCGLPIVIYAANGLCESIEEFLCVRADERPRVTYKTEEDFFREVDRLITDEAYRQKQSERIKSFVLKPEEFQKQLKCTIEYEIPPITPVCHEVDYEKRKQINIDTENGILHRYPGILLRSTLLRKKRPVRYLWEAAVLVVKSDKKYLYDTAKRILLNKTGRK